MKSNKTVNTFCLGSLLTTGLIITSLASTTTAGLSIPNPTLIECNDKLCGLAMFDPHAVDAARTVCALMSDMIPIQLTIPQGSVSSGASMSCTVTVQSVPANGGYVQINCDTPSALSNSSGSWPLAVYFAPGSSTTASFTLTANNLSSSTAVNLYYGAADADPNDPSQWGAGGSVTVAQAEQCAKPNNLVANANGNDYSNH